MRANAPAGAQTRAHRAIKPFPETIEILFRRAQAKILQMVGAPVTREPVLLTTNAERASRWQPLHVAKDGLLDRHVGQHEIAGDVILVHLRVHKWQAVEALGHGCERKAVGRGNIEERTFPDVIAGQEEMLFLLVPDREAEGAGKMVNALFVPTLPCGQQQIAVGHCRGLLLRET